MVGKELARFAFKKILPLCDAPPKVKALKLVPKLASSAAVISRMVLVASVEPLMCIRLVVVVGFKVREPVPDRVEDQSILLPVKLMFPIPVTAPVNAMVPVPELIVMLLEAPARARATVIFALLALLSNVKSECKVTGIVLPNVIAPPADVLVVVAIVPPRLSADGIVGAKAPPE